MAERLSTGGGNGSPRSDAGDPQARALRFARELNEAALQLGRELSPAEIADVAGRAAVAALGSGEAGLWVVDASRKAMVRADARVERGFPTVPIDDTSPLGFTVLTGAAVFLSGPSEYAQRFPASWRRVCERGTPDLAVAVIAAGEPPLAGLVLWFPAPRRFDGEEREFLCVLARHCGHALERAALRARAAAAAAQAERLQGLTAALAAADDVDSVCRVLVQHGRVALGADRCAVALPEADDLRIRASDGLGPQMLERVGRFPIDSGYMSAGAFRARAAIFLETDAEMSAHVGSAWTLRQTGSKAAAAIPLLVGDAALGVISAGYDAEHAFSDADRAFALAMAAQAAQVLDRVQLRERERQSREQLTRMFQQTPLPIAVFEGPEHRYVLANPAYRTLFGGRRLEGLTLREVAPELDGSDVHRMLDHVRRTGERLRAINFPAPLPLPDGTLTERWFDFSVEPLLDPAGKVAGIVTAGAEVTEQVRARQATDAARIETAAASQRVQAILEQMPAGVMVAEAPSGKVVLANAAAARILLQVPPAAPGLIEWKGYRAFHEDGREFQPGDWPLRRALGGAIVDAEEARVLRGDGSEVWLSVTAAPLFTGDRITGAAIAFMDVTARREAEAAAEAARAEAEAERKRLSNLLDQMPVGVALADPNGTIVLHNREVERIWSGGFPRDRRERLGVMDARRADGRPLRPEDFPFARAMASGTTASDEMLVRRPDGSEIWLSMSATPLRDASGAISDVVVIVIDITANKRAEQEIAGARASAEAASRAKDEFLALLGHELRNPLAPIVTALQIMALRDGGGATVRERNVIERQVRHLSRLVDDLLDVSRVARGKLELRRFPVELSRVAAAALELVSPVLEQRRHRVTLDVPRTGLLVDGDESRLVQVLANLLGNAAKYSDEGSSIRVSARREKDEAVMGVRDDGIGIDAELLPRIFDSFVQGPRSLDRAQGGLGLGLTLVRSIVELHGGSVSAASGGPGRGSEFTVRLPLSIRKATRPEAGIARGVPTAGGCRLLLVDDNADAAAMLAELLREAGHEVLVAGDGPSALRAMETFVPEIAVLDIGLPVMDGYELAAQVRARLGQRVRLVALTGYGQAEDRQRALHAGFDAHLVKPVEIAALFEALGPDRGR